jgi:hypothetical protein
MHLAEQGYGLTIQRRNIVGFAARHKLAVDDDPLVDILGAGVFEIGLERRPCGNALAERRARLDQRPGAVTYGGNRFIGSEK